jgi:endo-1,4-beta-xylanase
MSLCHSKKFRLLLLAALVCAATARGLSHEEAQQLWGARTRAASAAAAARPLRYLTFKNFDANETLRSAAARAGIRVGAALAVAHLQNASDPLFSRTAAEEFNLAVAENECKYWSTEPTRDNFTTSNCSVVVDTMRAAGGAARLHNYAWAGANPGWLYPKPAYSNATLLGILQNHIARVGGAFAGQVVQTDVINEPFSNTAPPNPETHDLYLKPMPPWYPAIRDYIPLALEAARAADPTSLRYINDYGAEDLGVKSSLVYNFSRGLVAASPGLLQGIGLQMHVDVDAYPDPIEVAANMKRLGELGLKVSVTEMDVRCTPPCGADRLALQAKIYGDVVEACLNNSGVCEGVVTWGVTDAFSWLWDFENPHHEDMQPLLFDVRYGKKPAYYEVLAVLQMAAERRAAPQACRDRFLWPFSAASIWNSPIGAGATYLPAGIYSTELPTEIHNDQVRFQRAKPPAEETRKTTLNTRTP